MVTVLLTSFLLLALIAFAIYRLQRVSPDDTRLQPLPPQPEFEGLFADSQKEEHARLKEAESRVDEEAKRRDLIARAKSGDKATLLEAHNGGDAELYDELLDLQVIRATNPTDVLALASYLSRSGGLPVNIRLAEAFINVWKQAPDRRSTSEMLHISALAGDSGFYLRAMSAALQFMSDQVLRDMSPQELAQLIESEFWLIPASERDSGSGFLLKRELAKMRRKLAARQHESSDK